MLKNSDGLLFVRHEIAARWDQWELIRDCLDGEVAVKSKGLKYLPYPTSKRVTNKEFDEHRYENYKSRAVFFNAVSRTLHDLMAQVFVKSPVFNVNEDDPVLKSLIDNASGDGVTLNQTSNSLLQQVLSYAYCGLLVNVPDYKQLSIRDYEDLKYKPTIEVVSPFNIRNFKYSTISGKEVLSLLVLEQSFILYDNDGFEIKRKPQITVFTNNGEHVSRIIYLEGDSGWKTVESKILLDIKGKPVKEIPFFFLGSDNNNPYPDNPIMYDLASLNISHYRNSADYEEMLFIAGQPTLVLSGLKVDKNKASSDLQLGSHSAILLDNGGTSSLMQIKSDSGLSENLERKEKLMAKIGAKFLDTSHVSKTATQVKLENPSQGSILGKCAINVSDVIKKSLIYVHSLLNLNSDDVDFQLNTDFEYNKLSSDNLQFALNCYNDGVLTLNEVRALLGRMGLTFDKVEGHLKTINREVKE